MRGGETKEVHQGRKEYYILFITLPASNAVPAGNLYSEFYVVSTKQVRKYSGLNMLTTQYLKCVRYINRCNHSSTWSRITTSRRELLLGRLTLFDRCTYPLLFTVFKLCP